MSLDKRLIVNTSPLNQEMLIRIKWPFLNFLYKKNLSFPIIDVFYEDRVGSYNFEINKILNRSEVSISGLIKTKEKGLSRRLLENSLNTIQEYSNRENIILHHNVHFIFRSSKNKLEHIYLENEYLPTKNNSRLTKVYFPN